ncbi:MAG: hypothetical protein Q7R43_03320 [Candidatus Daviesbacteria bacterium]|nr:hypothetical protein [Candidatus Daviesbacteria bacterium]
MGPAGIEQLQQLLQRIINLSVGFAFIVLLIMLLVTGIKYLTSGGESKPLASAGNSLTWTLLGIIFLVIIWLVLLLVRALTGVDVTKFCIGFPPYCL